MGETNSYKPEIIAFFCQWCAYTAADNAGRARLELPSGIKVIRVMCSGRIDPDFILNAIRKGSDGVFIVGCLDGNCHYKKGNSETAKRIVLLQSVLKSLSIDPERLLFEGIKADDPQGLSEIMNRFINKIASLGPLSV